MRCWFHHLLLAVLNVLPASQMISPPSLTIELKLECPSSIQNKNLASARFFIANCYLTQSKQSIRMVTLRYVRCRIVTCDPRVAMVKCVTSAWVQEPILLRLTQTKGVASENYLLYIYFFATPYEWHSNC